MEMNRLNTLLGMLESDSHDAFVRYALAKEYENLADYNNAIKHFLILKETKPDYVGMYYHLAKLYERLDNTDMAILTYNEGIEEATKISDFHALSELKSAKLNLEMEM